MAVFEMKEALSGGDLSKVSVERRQDEMVSI